MVKFVSKSTFFSIQVTELLSEGYESAQNGIAEHQLPAVPFKRNVNPCSHRSRSYRISVLNYRQIILADRKLYEEGDAFSFR